MMKLNVLVPHSVVSSTGPIRGNCKSLSQSVVFDSLKPFLLNGIPPPVHQSVRDLGVIVNDSLTPYSHIAKITATAYQRINLIFRCFVSRDVPTLFRAYTTYIRPLLEYNTVVWSPSLECDICNVEKVQRKFTKRLPNIAMPNAEGT